MKQDVEFPAKVNEFINMNDNVHLQTQLPRKMRKEEEIGTWKKLAHGFICLYNLPQYSKIYAT